MTDKTKGEVVATEKNYSKEQEQILKDNAPMNLEKARALEEAVGHSWSSIIAKCKHLGVEYISKPKPTKKVAKVTKAELAAQIAERLDRNLDGLDKAPAKALVNLINGIDHLTKALPEANPTPND